MFLAIEVPSVADVVEPIVAVYLGLNSTDVPTRHLAIADDVLVARSFTGVLDAALECERSASCPFHFARMVG
jgi:hypothetical protein